LQLRRAIVKSLPLMLSWEGLKVVAQVSLSPRVLNLLECRIIAKVVSSGVIGASHDVSVSITVAVLRVYGQKG
jgi:hypothetical protein